MVLASASLKEGLDDAARVYDDQSGDAVKISYTVSSTLTKQIESGAPADVFISSDLDWMDYPQQRNLIQPSTRKKLLGNRLVIVAAADSDLKLDIKPGFDLAGARKGGHLAMTDPDSVPAGKYEKAALEKLGVRSSVRAAVAPAENVRAASLFVSRREAPLGLFTRPMPRPIRQVKIAGVFPEAPKILTRRSSIRRRSRPTASFIRRDRRQIINSSNRPALAAAERAGQYGEI